MRVLLLSVCLTLSACAASNWVNPRNPAADLQADTAACEKEVQRMARFAQLGNPAVSQRSCVGPASCVSQEEAQSMQVLAEAVSAKKRCMAARGWRQA